MGLIVLNSMPRIVIIANSSFRHQVVWVRVEELLLLM